MSAQSLRHGSSPILECGGLVALSPEGFTLLAPIFEGSFEGPPLLRLTSSAR